MPNILEDELRVINIGLKQFYEALVEQKISPIHYEWQPPLDEEEEAEMAGIMDFLL